jgi:hypothetical protein
MHSTRSTQAATPGPPIEELLSDQGDPGDPWRAKDDPKGPFTEADESNDVAWWSGNGCPGIQSVSVTRIYMYVFV